MAERLAPHMHVAQGCQIFLVERTKTGKMFQMFSELTKLSQNLPNGKKIIHLFNGKKNIFIMARK
jgi:hypothetical protein